MDGFQQSWIAVWGGTGRPAALPPRSQCLPPPGVRRSVHALRRRSGEGPQRSGWPQAEVHWLRRCRRCRPATAAMRPRRRAPLPALLCCCNLFPAATWMFADHCQPVVLKPKRLCHVSAEHRASASRGPAGCSASCSGRDCPQDQVGSQQSAASRTGRCRGLSGGRCSEMTVPGWLAGSRPPSDTAVASPVAAGWWCWAAAGARPA